MALYNNFGRISDNVKIATRMDTCYICAKKKGVSAKLDANETMQKMQGHIENQKALFFTRSGIDTVICMNCIKDIYDEHIAPTLPKEEVKEEKPVKDKVEEKKSNTKKK